MSDYILKAIEYVERKATAAHARLDGELDAERVLAADDGATTSTRSAVEAGIDEIERIQRQAASAKQDYTAIYGKPDSDEEAVA